MIALLVMTACVFTVITGCAKRYDNDATLPGRGVGRSNIVSEAPVDTSETEVSLPKNGYTICVDPGHGFDDPGTSSEYIGDFTEKDINFDVAIYLRDALEKLGYTVIMTHDGESFPKTSAFDNNNKYKPDERVAYVNALETKIDYYISLHCNSHTSEDASGTRIYYYEGASKPAGFDLDISNSLAESLAAAFPDARTPVVENDIFYVIRFTNFPASLVELGFVTNPDEVKNMIDPEWQQKYAEALAEGINNYFTENQTN